MLEVQVVWSAGQLVTRRSRCVAKSYRLLTILTPDGVTGSYNRVRTKRIDISTHTIRDSVLVHSWESSNYQNIVCSKVLPTSVYFFTFKGKHFQKCLPLQKSEIGIKVNIFGQT